MARKSKKRIEMGEKAWAEYQRIRQNEKSNRWKSQHAESVVNWRRRTKLKLIEYKGGKCQQCGYDKKVPGAYDFHHRDPKKKSFRVGGMTLKWETLKKEVNKCDLLCKICHAEVHDEQYRAIRQQSIKKYKDWLNKREKIVRKNCNQCKIPFLPKTNSVKYCSEKCAQMAARKIERPTKNKLANLINDLSWTAIGRKYGVSDNAIRKWARQYGII